MRTRQLRRAVFRLQGCFGALGKIEKRVLVLRTGFGGAGTKTVQETAGSLGIPIARVQKLERRGLRDLRASAAAGGCQGQSDGSVFSSFSFGFSSFPPAASATPLGTGSGSPREGLFAGPLTPRTGAARLDDLPVRLLLFVGLAAVILAVGLLFHTWREGRGARRRRWERRARRRRRRFKRRVTRVAQLQVAMMMRGRKAREAARHPIETESTSS